MRKRSFTLSTLIAVASTTPGCDLPEERVEKEEQIQGIEIEEKKVADPLQEVEEPEVVELPTVPAKPKDWDKFVDEDGNCIPQRESGESCFFMSDIEIMEVFTYRYCKYTCMDGAACKPWPGEERVGGCFPSSAVSDEHKEVTGDK